MADDDIVVSVKLEGDADVNAKLASIGDQWEQVSKRIAASSKQAGDSIQSALDKANAAGAAERRFIPGGSSPRGAPSEESGPRERGFFGSPRGLQPSLAISELLRLGGLNFPGLGLATHVGVEGAEAAGASAGAAVGVGALAAALVGLNVALEKTADTTNDFKKHIGDLLGSPEAGDSIFGKIRQAGQAIGLAPNTLASPVEAAAKIGRGFVQSYPGEPTPTQFSPDTFVDASKNIVQELKSDRLSSSEAAKTTTKLFEDVAEKQALTAETFQALPPKLQDALAHVILTNPTAGPGGLYPTLPAGRTPGLSDAQELIQFLKENPNGISGQTLVGAAAKLKPDEIDTKSESLGTAFGNLGEQVNTLLGNLTPFKNFATIIQTVSDDLGKFNKTLLDNPKVAAGIDRAVKSAAESLPVVGPAIVAAKAASDLINNTSITPGPSKTIYPVSGRLAQDEQRYQDSLRAGGAAGTLPLLPPPTPQERYRQYLKEGGQRSGADFIGPPAPTPDQRQKEYENFLNSQQPGVGPTTGGRAASGDIGLIPQIASLVISIFSSIAEAAGSLDSTIKGNVQGQSGTRGALGGLLTSAGFLRFAGGGSVHGPGNGTSDSILAALSTGEYVHNSASVRHYGTQFMNSINNMSFPKFSFGGLVDGITAGMSLPRFSAGGLPSSGNSNVLGHYTVDLSTDRGVVRGLRAGGEVIDQLSRIGVSTRQRSAFTGSGTPDWYNGGYR